ncbi:MAG: acylphosphatase [Abitibacteriaceae bacterium]|nr:acylphosphatase [Abditibacteriaceae bacterium]
MADSTKQQVHVFYTGRVQGVGFRYLACQTAQQWQMQGWVRNLTDGRVELVAIGEATALREFLDALRHGPLERCILDAQVEWGSPMRMYEDFHIRPTGTL